MKLSYERGQGNWKRGGESWRWVQCSHIRGAYPLAYYIQVRDRDVQQLQAEIVAKNEQIAKKDDEIQQLIHEVEVKNVMWFMHE